MSAVLSPSQLRLSTHPGHLRNPRFDLALIVGPVLLALGLTLVALQGESWFWLVIGFNVWFVATPHAFSSYTRVPLNRSTLSRHWFLLLMLPFVILGFNAFVGWGWGAGGLMTVYFVAQTWHYTRQSYGIARAYRHVVAGVSTRVLWLAYGVLYGLPLAGIVHRSAQHHSTFYGYPLYLLSVPPWVGDVFGMLALSIALVWLLDLTVRCCQTRAFHRFDQFVASHAVMVGMAYWLFEDITLGWLLINLWHNFQYLLFVWAQNVRRHQGASTNSPQPWIAWLSQPQRVWQYALFCLVCGALIYSALTALGRQWSIAQLPLLMMLVLTLNFHHYAMDSQIWKRSFG